MVSLSLQYQIKKIGQCCYRSSSYIEEVASNLKCEHVDSSGVGRELSLRAWDSRKSLEGELIPLRVCAH